MTLSILFGQIRIAVQSRWPIAGLYRFQRIGFLLVVLGLSASLAAAEPAKRVFNIEAQPATQSLIDYARQAHTQLGYDVDIVDAILTNPVVGEYDPAEALELLLEDTGLQAEFGNRGIFIRRVATREVGGGIEGRAPAVAETNSLRFAQTFAAGAQLTVTQNQTSRSTEKNSGNDEKKRPLEEIVVTGTNIRGIAPESSPTWTFDREDLLTSGASTAQDFLQLMPQNFGGGSQGYSLVGLPDDDSASFNTGQGSFGSSVNLRGFGSGSTLVLLNGHRLAPSSGIGDFVDIAMIPTSAIERVEVLTDGASSIYGADAIAGVVNFVLRDDFEGLEITLRHGTAHGDVDEYRASLTAGGQWDSGHALATYEFFDVSDLSAEDRTFSNAAPLPNDLLPCQNRHSIFGTVSQKLNPDVEVFADLLYSDRKAVREFTNPGLESFRTAPTSDNLNISSGGSWKVSKTWFLDISGTYSKLQINANSTGADTLGRRHIDSDAWMTDYKASGAILALPAGDLKVAIGGHYREEDFTNFDPINGEVVRHAGRNVSAFFGEAFIPIVGADNVVPAIERLELSISARVDRFSDFDSTTNPKIGVLWSPIDALSLRGSYSTSFNPPPLGRVGANDISILVARTSLINSLLGLTAGDPSIADVVELSVSGTAKDLDAEESKAFTMGFDFSEQRARHRFTLSATWFDIAFENRLGSVPVPGNRPTLDAPNIAFNNPDLFPEGAVIFFPTLEQVNDALSSVDRPLFNVDGSNPLDAGIINSVLLVRNLARTEVTGFDFDLDYSLDADLGVFSAGVSGTFLHDFEKQAAITTPLVEQIGTLYNPVDLRLRGRTAYSRDGFGANLFINYTGAGRVDNTADAARIDSWTTVDVTLSYDTREKYSNSALDNAVLRLSVRNLFDKDPPSTPSIPSLGIFGFDPTNASPLGRFTALEVTKRFF